MPFNSITLTTYLSRDSGLSNYNFSTDWSRKEYYMNTLRRYVRTFAASGAIALAVSGPGAFRIATMAGEARPGAIAAVAAGGAAVVGGIKLLTKEGVATRMILLDVPFLIIR